MQEMRKRKDSVIYPLRGKWVRFMEELEELSKIELDPENPVGELRKGAQRIIDEHPLIFWMNSKSMLLFHRITIAPFEKRWGKPLRKVYRTRLSEIFKKVDKGEYDLSPDVKLKILEGVRMEYLSLAGKKNIFHRYPCSEGKKKISLKIESINYAMKNIGKN